MMPLSVTGQLQTRHPVRARVCIHSSIHPSMPRVGFQPFASLRQCFAHITHRRIDTDIATSVGRSGRGSTFTQTTRRRVERKKTSVRVLSRPFEKTTVHEPWVPSGSGVCFGFFKGTRTARARSIGRIATRSVGEGTSFGPFIYRRRVSLSLFFPSSPCVRAYVVAVDGWMDE